MIYMLIKLLYPTDSRHVLVQKVKHIKAVAFIEHPNALYML